MDPGGSQVTSAHGQEHDDGDAPTPRLHRTSLIRRLADGTVVVLFLLLLFAAPLPLGANRDWAWTPIAILVGAFAVLSAAGLGAQDAFRLSREERAPLLVLIGCFAAFVAVALLQMSTIFAPSGAAHFYGEAAEILGQAHAAVPSLAIDASRNVLLKCLTCGLIFAIARAIS
ncbi:MAG: hypothetical protein ACHQK9_20270, partial [Reyranellales bacterium]